MPARLAASCLAAVLALLPISPSAAQSAAGPTLRFVPHADLAILDPLFHRHLHHAQLRLHGL